MSRPFAFVTFALASMMSFMIGLIVAGSVAPAPAASQPQRSPAEPRPAGVRARSLPARAAGSLVNFAALAGRINPAVGKIEATTPGGESTGRPRRPPSDA